MTPLQYAAYHGKIYCLNRPNNVLVIYLMINKRFGMRCVIFLRKNLMNVYQMEMECEEIEKKTQTPTAISIGWLRSCVKKLVPLQHICSEKCKLKLRITIVCSLFFLKYIILGHELIANLLLKSGADVNMAVGSQITALHYAALYGISIINLLAIRILAFKNS